MAGILDDILPFIQGQESQGNPFAISPVGAQGLMQVMPATASDPGFGVTPARYASGKYDPSNPNDVAENKREGGDYFSALYNKYGGDVPTALAAYNWGPGHVDKWIKLGKPQNLLPAETQDYVHKIMAHLQGNAQPGTMPGSVTPGSGGNSSVAMNVLPQAIPASNTGQAPMPTPSAPPSDTGTGFDINGLLKQYQNGLGSLGPSLMALGAGIAAGGAPGGGGWGAGLGQGLQGANQIQQQRLHNTLSLAELANSLGLQNAYLGMAQRKENQPPDNLVAGLGQFNASASDLPRTLALGMGMGPDYNQADWSARTGVAGQARGQLESLVDSERQMRGMPPLDPNKPADQAEYNKYIPDARLIKNDPQAAANKYNDLFKKATSTYDLFRPRLPAEQQAQMDQIMAPYRKKVTLDAIKQQATQQQTNVPSGVQQAGAGGSPQVAAPQAGTKRGKYTFKGGDPSDPNNWVSGTQGFMQ